MKKTGLKVILPVTILLIGLIASWTLVQSSEEATAKPSKPKPPRVKTVPVQPQMLRMTVHSQGTVRPSTVVELTAEVLGKVVKVAPNFREGGFFEKGELLMQIDPRDYDLAVVEARAQVTQAHSRVLQAKANVMLARKGWQSIGKGEPNPLALKKPQLKAARARLKAAKAALEKALLRRQRTEIRAPFDALIREKWVGVGEYVEEGTRISRLMAVDKVEIALPVTMEELAFLDLPLAPRQDLEEKGPKVILWASLAGERHRWQGRIVRTEGVIDEQTRLLYVIAEVQDPYGYLSDSRQAPLLVGLFVEAAIKGRTLGRTSLLPRQALHLGNRVWVVNAKGELHYRQVEVLRAKDDWMVVRGGLQPGDAVVVTPLPQATEGMEVNAKRTSLLAWVKEPS